VTVIRPDRNPRPALTRRQLFERLAISLGATALPRLASSEVPATAPVTFGVFPYLPALEIGRQFGPMASALSKVVGRPVSLQTKSGFPAFQAALLEARYDIALLHPFLYGDVAPIQDYRPLARLQEDLSGVIVAPQELRIAGFADLRGETIAVPPALSAVAKLVALELHRLGLDGPDGVTLAHYRTKTACLHAVVGGRASVCAVPAFALRQLGRFSPVVLEAKFQTAAIPGILFVGHGRLGEANLRKLEETLVSWNGSVEGRRLLAGLGWSGIVPIVPGQYDTAQLRHALDR
jgi:ABC-type phosphate/phosphonate transport system substrate-binding protein